MSIEKIMLYLFKIFIIGSLCISFFMLIHKFTKPVDHYNFIDNWQFPMLLALFLDSIRN
jgi:hypothetical protein